MLCNGTNGTPNLKDRFIVGAAGAYGVGTTGGKKEVTLSEKQLPTHNHTGATGNAGNHKHTGTIQKEGNHSHSYNDNYLGNVSFIGSVNICLLKNNLVHL